MTLEELDEYNIMLKCFNLLISEMLDNNLDYVRQLFEIMQEKYGVYVSDYTFNGEFDFDSFVIECYRKKKLQPILN